MCVRVPVYMSDDFKLTYRVSLYLERSLLCLLDLSRMVFDSPFGVVDEAMRFDIWGGEGSGFS